MENRPTVFDREDFDKDRDAMALRRACKGLGTDEDVILAIMCNRTALQRVAITRHYKAAYGRDLKEDLKDELSGDFQDVIMALMQPQALYDARCLKKAMDGIGTDEEVLLEIMCARSNEQMIAIKAAYKFADLGDSLEEDIKDDTRGDLEKLLVGLSVGARDFMDEVDEEKVAQDISDLMEASEGLGTDETAFQRILVTRSHAHTRAFLVAYAAAAGKTVMETIDDEMSGDLQRGYRNIVMYIRNPHRYYAEKLYKAMKGLGTDEDALIRVLVTRSEVDLGAVADIFEIMYEQPLIQFIEDDVSGDFKRALIALVITSE